MSDPLEAADAHYFIENSMIDQLGLYIDGMDDPNGPIDEGGNLAVIVSVYYNKSDVFSYLVGEKGLAIGRSLDVVETNMKYSNEFEEMHRIICEAISLNQNP